MRAGCLLLPGIVDIHGDAFERQMMPRPGVHVALDIALIDSDRQAVANGITTVFHGVTWSWEPGLRGSENARAILAGIEQLRDRLAADTRYHLRHETFNLEAETEICDWVEARRVGAVAFNDHLPAADSHMKRPDKLNQMVERSGHPARGFSRSWSSGCTACATRCRHRSPASPPGPMPTTWRFCRMTTRARSSGSGSARAAAGSASFR